MRVIEKGTPKVYKCTGNGNSGGGCGAKLEVEHSDLFRTGNQSVGDSSPTYYATFRCPECDTLTDVAHPRPESLPMDPRQSSGDPRD